MRLVRLAKKEWDVLAVANARGHSVLDALAEWADSEADSGRERKSGDAEQRAASDMIYILREYVPDSGPRKDSRFSKPLGDGVFEFKTGPKRGKKLRVLYFYGGSYCPQTVVCVSAFFKREEADQESIKSARQIRHRFLADATESKLKIIEDLTQA